MAISVDKANIVFKDKQGNVGKVQSLSDSDIAKISANITNTNELTTALSDEISARANADTILQASSISLGNRVESLEKKTTAIDTNYVTTNTSQTVDGEKTFTNQWTYFKNNNADLDNYSKYDIDKDQKIWFTDKNGERYAYMGAIQDKNGNRIIEIGTYKQSTSTYSIGFKAFYNSETGQAWADGVNLLPTGALVPFASTNIPSGFLLCNGAAVSRTTYKRLFDIIGTTWGSGDGSTTFNIPDLNDRFIEGTGWYGNVGNYIGAGLPNIWGSFGTGDGSPLFWKSQINGAFYGNTRTPVYLGANTSDNPRVSYIDFNANRNNGLYGANSSVQPNSIHTYILIKT